MIRKPLFALLVVGLLTVLAAGCGSSSTTSHSTATASTLPANTSTSGGSSSSSPAAAQAVAKCKSVVNGHSSSLSPSLKSRLIGVCNNVGTNSAGLKQAIGQVCTQVVNSTVPSSAPKAIKDQALAACKKVSG